MEQNNPNVRSTDNAKEIPTAHGASYDSLPTGVRGRAASILRDLQANSGRVRTLLFSPQSPAPRKKDFVESVGLLACAGLSEAPLIKALLYGIPLPKAYMMAACVLPLYTTGYFCVPFSLAKPEQLFRSMMVAKTRMLATAATGTGAESSLMYNAARDKLWKEFIPNDQVPLAHAPNILATLSEPYWSFTTYRTQLGESKASATRYIPSLPQGSNPMDFVPEDLPEISSPSPRKHTLATTPQQRRKDIVLTGDDLEDF